MIAFFFIIAVMFSMKEIVKNEDEEHLLANDDHEEIVEE